MPFNTDIHGLARQPFSQYLNNPKMSHGTFETTVSEPRTRARWTPEYQLRTTTGEDGQTIITISGKIIIKTVPADGAFGTEIIATKLVVDADQHVMVTLVPALNDKPPKSLDPGASIFDPEYARSAPSVSGGDLFGTTTSARYVSTQTQTTRDHGIQEYDGSGHQNNKSHVTQALGHKNAGTFTLNPRAAAFVPDSTPSPKTSSVGLSGASFGHGSPFADYISKTGMFSPVTRHGGDSGINTEAEGKRPKEHAPEAQSANTTKSTEHSVSPSVLADLPYESCSYVDLASSSSTNTFADNRIGTANSKAAEN